MSYLVVMGFDEENRADEVLLKISQLQKEHLIDLEDAAIVVRRKDGKTTVKQVYDLVATGAAGGSFWGLLFGLLFLHPLVGVLAGAAAGAVAGALDDVGINDQFIKELAGTLTPGTSALFVLVRQATLDRVVAELKPYHGKILHTSLSHDDEEAFKKALEEHHEALATA